MNMHELLDRFSSLLFPPRCVICQELTAYDSALCGKCAYDTHTDDVGAKIFHSGAKGAVVIMAYDAQATNALINYKKYGDKRATAFFCNEIYSQIAEKWNGAAFDIVTPVPMSKKGRRERGFNQAELLAHGLAALMDASLRTDMLKRLDGSLPQHMLDRKNRLENAARSYTAGNMAGIENKNILLVDDVITTGATVGACVRLLISSGAANVYAAAVASSD